MRVCRTAGECAPGRRVGHHQSHILRHKAVISSDSPAESSAVTESPRMDRSRRRWHNTRGNISHGETVQGREHDHHHRIRRINGVRQSCQRHSAGDPRGSRRPEQGWQSAEDCAGRARSASGAGRRLRAARTGRARRGCGMRRDSCDGGCAGVQRRPGRGADQRGKGVDGRLPDDRRRRGRLRRRADHGPASDRCGPGGQGARQAHDVRAAGRGPAALVGHRIARSVVFRDRGTPAFAGTRPIRGRRLGEARHDRRGGEGCRRTCGGGDVHGRHHEPDAGARRGFAAARMRHVRGR